MTQRIDYAKVAPQGAAALLGLEKYVRHCGLPESLPNLVGARAPQINGCAFCLDMHSKDARAAGETEARLYVLPAWRDDAEIRSRRSRELEFRGGARERENHPGSYEGHR